MVVDVVEVVVVYKYVSLLVFSCLLFVIYCLCLVNVWDCSRTYLKNLFITIVVIVVVELVVVVFVLFMSVI